MDNVQRVSAFLDLQTGECPPRTADRKQGFAGVFAKPVDLVERGADFLLHFRHVAGHLCLKTHRAERQRYHLLHLAVVKCRQFETATAKVRDNSVFHVKSVLQGLGRKKSFFLSVENFDRATGHGLDGREQLAAIRRIADCRCRKCFQTVDPVTHRKLRKTHDGGEGAVHCLLRQCARFAEPGAETAEYPLVEQWVRVSVGDIENDQPNGIRPDVDDRESFVLVRELRRNASVSIGCWHRDKQACGPVFHGDFLKLFLKRAAAS